MDTSLNLSSNPGFALLDEGFLVCEFMRREQRLQSLGLQLLGYNFGALITLSWSGCPTHYEFDALYNRALLLGADLLSPLKRNER